MENGFAMTLRQPMPADKGLAPAGPLRDQQAERRRALANSANILRASAPAKRECLWASAARGAFTQSYSDQTTKKPLALVPKPARATMPTAKDQQRRLAILSRWYKAHKAAGQTVPEVPPSLSTVSVPLGMGEGTRLARRGEFDHLAGSYHNYSPQELLALVEQQQDKATAVKWPEMDRLYAEGKQRVPAKSVQKIMYPKSQAAGKIDALRAKGLPAFGSHRQVSILSETSRTYPCPHPWARTEQVLTLEQENFALGLAVEMAFQHKPISPEELQRWAAVTSRTNGTRPDEVSMRTWFEFFCRRATKEHGINLLAVKPQQLSKQRAGVLLSGMRKFQEMIHVVLHSHPELEAEGLRAHGNWDELKFDLNKLLTDGTSLVPEGQLPQWEVDGERCEQITLLAGLQRPGVGQADQTQGDLVGRARVVRRSGRLPQAASWLLGRRELQRARRLAHLQGQGWCRPRLA